MPVWRTLDNCDRRIIVRLKNRLSRGDVAGLSREAPNPGRDTESSRTVRRTNHKPNKPNKTQEDGDLTTSLRAPDEHTTFQNKRVACQIYCIWSN